MGRQNSWSERALPDAVPRLRRAVVEFARATAVDGVPLDAVAICVSEAVTNAVVHGFRDGREVGLVSVVAEARSTVLVVTVRDDGIGWGPRADSPGLGFGLSTIGALTDAVQLRALRGGGTELRMAFGAGGDADAPAG
jgi:serine/threonine-protein kinase RsbW